MRKEPKRILAGIVVILFLCGVFYAMAVARAKAQLRETYATLKNNGRPLQPEDLVPPESAALPNAAPQYQAALSVLKKQYVEDKTLLEYLGTLSVQSRHEASSVRRSKMKELLGRDVVAQALSSLERETSVPVCHVDRDYLPNDLKTPFPALEDLRNAVLILGAKARMESEGEKPSNAWDTVQTPLRLISTLVSDPTFECQWLRLTETNYLCEVIQKICEAVRPSARDYEVVEDILKKQADVALLIHTLDAQRLLIGERLFSMPDDTLYETLQNSKLSGKDYTHRGMDYPHRNISRPQFRLATFKPRFIADHATYLQLMSKCVEFFQAPYAPNETNASQEIRSLETCYFFTNRLAPPIRATKMIYCNAATMAHVTRAGLALLQYRERHDRFPEKLDALNLAGLIDPFTLKPLCYRTDDEGFCVYGVGEDLKDNGGVQKQSRQRTDYDIVWRCPGPKNEEPRGL